MAKVVTLSILVFFVGLHLFEYVEEVPRSFSAIQWFLLMALLGAPRLVFSVLVRGTARDVFRKQSNDAVPVVLAPAGDAAEHFIRAMSGPFNGSYNVVGLLDNDAAPGRRIHGIPVLGRTSDLDEIFVRLASGGNQPQRLIICDDKFELSREMKTELFDKAAELGLRVARLPGPAELHEGEAASKPKLNPIALEDLLGRPQTELDRQDVNRMIRGRKVLITGAGGTIGSELARQIAALEPSLLVLVEFSEWNLYQINVALDGWVPDDVLKPVICNIRDRDRLMQVFDEHRPDLVFHAAALKHVPMVEMNPSEGVLTNVIGSRNVIDAAKTCGVKAFVQVSTDKAVNPTSLMGATKRLAEFYCQALDLEQSATDCEAENATPRFMTVRFGNVLGSSGSVVPRFQQQLKQGGPLTVTHPDMERYFMTVNEAVDLILQASAHGIEDDEERGKILVLDMGDPIKIMDIAKQMVRLAGLRPNVDIEIAVTGLRPGEKLFEELFDKSEQRSKAALEGILVAQSQAMDPSLLRKVFADLAEAAENGDTRSIKRLVKHVLASYDERSVTAA